jgi:hypothetical protein
VAGGIGYGPPDPQERTMSIFGSIMSKIFGHPAAAAASGTSASATPESSAATPEPGAPPSYTPAGAVGSQAPVDVEAVLTAIAAQKPGPSNWRQSIVDLMKLLDLDSSLGARKQLATELNYPGDQNDSASMNIWLHKQVMQKLAENGGKVPDSLKV